MYEIVMDAEAGRVNALRRVEDILRCGTGLDDARDALECLQGDGTETYVERGWRRAGASKR
jgi:hypothetical protein